MLSTMRTWSRMWIALAVLGGLGTGRGWAAESSEKPAVSAEARFKDYDARADVLIQQLRKATNAYAAQPTDANRQKLEQEVAYHKDRPALSDPAKERSLKLAIDRANSVLAAYRKP